MLLVYIFLKMVEFMDNILYVDRRLWGGGNTYGGLRVDCNVRNIVLVVVHIWSCSIIGPSFGRSLFCLQLMGFQIPFSQI